MYFVYLIRSLKDKNNYTGHTKDVKQRLEQHNNGKVESTKFRRPFELIYYEGSLNKKDALHREKYSPREMKYGLFHLYLSE